MEVLKIAMRYLRTRRIALVCVFSVSMGVMALIVVTSLMDGVVRFYRSSVRATMADMWVVDADLAPTAWHQHFRHVQELLGPLMAEAGGPIAALAPRQLGAAIIVRGETLQGRREDSDEGIRLLGIDFDLERKLVPLQRMLADVKDVRLAVPPEQRDDPLGLPASSAGDHPPILLGDNLARRLGVARIPGPGVTNLVTVFAVELLRDRNGKLKAPRRKGIFRVAGCFTTGREDYDGHLAYVDREVLLRLRFEHPSQQLDASRIFIRFVDGSNLEQARKAVLGSSPGLVGKTWKQDNENLLKALQDQKRILLVILTFIILVACAAIFGFIWMLVVEKMRDIGILRSMGMSRAKVALTFVIYGNSLALIGCGLGLLLGLVVTAHLDAVITALGRLFGVQLLDPEVYRFESVPTWVDPLSITWIILGVLAGALISSLIPATRAAFMTPLRCLGQDSG